MLTHLKSDKRIFGRVTDLKDLNLPQAYESRVQGMVHEDRMLWELWVETAESYQDLKKAMMARGYTNLPSHSMPIIRKTNASDEVHLANQQNFQVPKTMIRRGKRN